MVNDREIAFIICVNNEIYFDECRYYIERLHVPEGYEIVVPFQREPWVIHDSSFVNENIR